MSGRRFGCLSGCTVGWRRKAGVAGAGMMVAVVASVFLAPAASAHPLGNFTTNTAVALRLMPDRVDLEYAIDEAEIPTVRAAGIIESDGLTRYAASTCDDVAAGVRATVGGERLTFAVTSSTAAYAGGAAGLRTLRVDCSLSAPADLSADETDIAVRNEWIGDRIGWHEITATGDGVTFSTGAPPTASTSDQLRSYPADQLAAPPDMRNASFRSSPGGSTDDGTTAAGGRHVAAGSVSALPGVDRASESFTDLVSKERLTLGVALAGLVLAIVLGSLHALAPGHGKTVMAAYLLGGEGSGRQALALCATVTATHTAGVLVLGTVLTVTAVVAPERLYPILGAISGLLVASIGLSMLRRARAARTTGYFGNIGHSHPHDPEHRPTTLAMSPTSAPAATPARHLVGIGAGIGVGVGPGSRPTRPAPRVSREVVPAPRGQLPAKPEEFDHSHPHPHPHPHSHGPHSHTHPDPGQPVSWKSLIGMGFAGGMVPSPSALLVLLGAIALGRTWFGVALVIAYGVGMAVSLVAAGLLLLRIRNRLDRYLSTRRGADWSKRLAIMPVVTAALVVAGGVYIALRAALQY